MRLMVAASTSWHPNFCASSSPRTVTLPDVGVSSPPIMSSIIQDNRIFAKRGFYHLKTKISSIGASTALEILIASFNDGLYCAFSRRIIVSRRTPTFSANCSCVRSFICRYFFNLHSNSAISYSSPSSAWSSWSYRNSKYSEKKIPSPNASERIIIAAIRVYSRFPKSFP